MQGRLRNAPLSIELQTACGHCGEPLHLTLDEALNISVHTPTAQPLVFQPQIDWDRFAEVNILNAY